MLAAVGFTAVGWSLDNALTRPSNNPTDTKLIAWVRDHRGGGLVNTIEAWWYSSHQPPKGETLTRGIPHPKLGPVVLRCGQTT